MKRFIAVILAALTAVLVLAACGEGSDRQVYVESVGTITGVGYAGLNNRYSGIVVSGSTNHVFKDKDKKILELNVSVGDKVSAGDVLFSYDIQAVELLVKKLELECEQLESSLELLEKNIAEYEKKVASAAASKKLEFEVQLQTYQVEEKEKRMELTAKQTELTEAENMLSNAEVTTKVTGVVQTINEDSAGETDENGDVIPYITIIETGAYRIKGTVSELDINSLREGSAVVIRSRVDDTTWTGTVEYIEWDNPEKNENFYYPEQENAASKYPFHVALDSTEGLILGQHVYVEMATEADAGMWLPDYYVVDADSEPWVWAAGKRDKLEKRDVELGEYNADTLCYEILSGLSAEDYIAFPDETLDEGMEVIYSDMMSGEEAGDIFYDDAGSYEGEDVFIEEGMEVFVEDAEVLG